MITFFLAQLAHFFSFCHEMVFVVLLSEHFIWLMITFFLAQLAGFLSFWHYMVFVVLLSVICCITLWENFLSKELYFSNVFQTIIDDHELLWNNNHWWLNCWIFLSADLCILLCKLFLFDKKTEIKTFYSETIYPNKA
jgi:Na+/melibiose symporter-like transporter